MKAAGFSQLLPGVARCELLPELMSGIPDLQIPFRELQSTGSARAALELADPAP